VKTMKHRAEENGLTLKYSVDKNINTFLTGDPVRLNQIITNLTANAIKFTKKGLVKISVKQVEDNNLSSLVQFTIEDTGIGIQNHKLSTIFESYTQATKETPFLYGGTGLGLTISKQLVELQGGTITVESEFGQGSTFTVTIPFKKSQEVLPVKQKVRDGIQNFNLSGIKILLVI
jgi:signal transduction histidine kinase